MNDQTNTEGKTKSPGLLRRILWWIWVILLAGLLLFGLFFAAPWKAITLIAIFLAAATILPRIYRKWFWACVGVVIIVLVIWIFLPEDNKGWRPYTFDKELAELQARYAIPNSENAAIIYNQIFADWKQKEANEPNLPERWFDRIHYVYWQSKDQPEIAAYIKYHQDTIEGLLQAAKIEKCSFPIATEVMDYSKNIDRNSAIRKFAYLLIAAGNNDMDEGKSNDAAEKYCTIIQIGRHLCQQPVVIDKLIGIAIESMGLQMTGRFAVSTDVDESALGKAEQTVAMIQYDLRSDLPGMISTEKLSMKNIFGLLYEVNSKGDIRFARDPMAKLREQMKDRLEYNDDMSSYWWKKLYRAQAIQHWFYMPPTPEKLSEIIDSCFETNYEITMSDFDRSKEPPEVPMESLFELKMNFRQHADLMARMSGKIYFNLHDIYLRNSAIQRGTLLIFSLKRYKNANGHWPDKLEDVNALVPTKILVDPISNDSFVYKLTDENFTLYSKGKNGIDDGGKSEKFRFPKDKEVLNEGCDDFMIWPTCKPSKEKQEKENVQQQ